MKPLVLQLLSWSDGPRGKKVVFEVMEVDGEQPDKNPFSNFTLRDKKVVGQMFAAALVEFDPATDEAKDRPTFLETHKPKKLSQIAAALCKDKDFQMFCRTNQGEEGAKVFLLARCDIKSRAELDSDIYAANQFETLKNHFDEWQLKKHPVRL